MISLPDELEPGYGEPYRTVLAALQGAEMADLPPALRRFALTPHELAVLRALEWLLEGRYEKLRPDGLAPGVDSELTAPSVDTLSKYRQHAAANPEVLRWSLLLHDVAKQRGLAGLHPENCAGVATRVLARVGHLSPAEKAQIVWLVRYHDMLGNIYCGERAPRFLLEASRGLDAAEVVGRLQLLQVVMLCDLRGTWDGALLTDAKARFWLDLAGPERILLRQADLFAWRLERWSGTVGGVANPAAERALREALFSHSDAAERRRLEAAFGDRIAYIVYGFYLFTALDGARLATLMRLVAREVDATAADQVSLVFDTVCRPIAFLQTDAERQAAGQALRHYTEQLQRNRLEMRVAREEREPARATIHVA